MQIIYIHIVILNKNCCEKTTAQKVTLWSAHHIANMKCVLSRSGNKNYKQQKPAILCCVTPFRRAAVLQKRTFPGVLSKGIRQHAVVDLYSE